MFQRQQKHPVVCCFCLLHCVFYSAWRFLHFFLFSTFAFFVFRNITMKEYKYVWNGCWQCDACLYTEANDTNTSTIIGWNDDHLASSSASHNVYISLFCSLIELHSSTVCVLVYQFNRFQLYFALVFIRCDKYSST